MRFSAGTRLRHFEITAPLGAGGMGEVYRARDLRLGREVAVKIVPEALLRDDAARQRLELEARAIASLSHPNILVVHELDHDESSNVTFIVAELLDGETLRARLSRSRIVWRKAAEIGAAIAEGLAAAHAKGIVHRDLKPENIMLTVDGRVKILDFGLAQTDTAFAGGSPESATVRHLTEPGAIVGTLGYMAPEQLRGVNVDARCDIFALGCILFEILTGQHPFRRSSGAETIAAILGEELPPRETISNETPPELTAVVRRCLEKTPELRFQSSRDLAFDLRTISTASDSKRMGKVSAVPSLAVLPFENASSVPESDYLSDGITESIINRLSNISGLRVMARSTAFRYKGKSIDPRDAGRELGVECVLTGGISQRGDRMMVRCELVDVATGAQLWGERRQHATEALFEVEEEIAREIVEKLRVRLTDDASDRLTRRQTTNSEAYHSYLKGRFYWFKRSEAGLLRGLEYFRQALDEDPAFALAYVGLADSYNILGFYSLLPPGDAFPKAEAAARRALEIDGQLAEAHTSLGYATHHHRWEWERAAASFRRALELRPDYPQAHQFYGNHLVALGRLEQGSQEFREALRLDPLALVLNAAVGWCHYYSHDFESSVTQLERTLAMDPSFGLAHLWLSWAFSAIGRFDEAVTHAREAEAAVRIEALTAQACAHAGAGRVGQAREILEELQKMARDRFVQPYELALIHAALGGTDSALTALEQAHAIHSHRVTFVKIDPHLDSLRMEPRFQVIEASMKFPA